MRNFTMKLNGFFKKNEEKISELVVELILGGILLNLMIIFPDFFKALFNAFSESPLSPINH